MRLGLPEGTIYAFPEISQTGTASQLLADMILEKAHVAITVMSKYRGTVEHDAGKPCLAG